MAIYVRELEHQAQFYTMSGRWINRSSIKITFFVPGFVDPKELDEIVPYLPDEEVDSSMEGRLQSFNESVPIGIGQPLVKKMIDFWNKADSTYQRAAMDLDGAHRTVADIFHYKYCSLQEIAAKVGAIIHYLLIRIATSKGTFILHFTTMHCSKKLL